MAKRNFKMTRGGRCRGPGGRYATKRQCAGSKGGAAAARKTRSNVRATSASHAKVASTSAKPMTQAQLAMWLYHNSDEITSLAEAHRYVKRMHGGRGKMSSPVTCKNPAPVRTRSGELICIAANGMPYIKRKDGRVRFMKASEYRKLKQGGGRKAPARKRRSLFAAQPTLPGRAATPRATRSASRTPARVGVPKEVRRALNRITGGAF